MQYGFGLGAGPPGPRASQSSRELLLAMSASFELVSRNGKPITEIDEWRDGLNKREQEKFVSFCSAYETARAWTEPNRGPGEVAALFARPPLKGFHLERAVVE